MEPLVVRASRWRLVLLGLLMLLFALLSLWLLSQNEGDVEAYIVGLGSLVFFSAVGLLLLAQVFRNKPVIVLSVAGIEDTRLKMGVIPWAEIERAYEVQYLWHENVQLQLRNPEQYRQRQPRLLRAFGYSKALGLSPFRLYTSYTDSSAKQIVDYIYRQLVWQWPTPAAVASTSVAGIGGEGEY